MRVCIAQNKTRSPLTGGLLVTDATVVGAYCIRPPGFQKVLVTHGSKWAAGLNERPVSAPGHCLQGSRTRSANSENQMALEMLSANR